MDGGRQPTGHPPAGRVVVVTRDSALLAEVQQTGGACIPAGSAYEAAAELLAEPAVAIVVDLRLMSPDHAELLQIARQKQVEMLAVGHCASLDAETLSGVRLVARRDVKAQLEKVLQAKAPPTGAPAAELPQTQQPQGQYVPHRPKQQAAQQQPHDQRPQPPSAEKLLTPQELAALLENTP